MNRSKLLLALLAGSFVGGLTAVPSFAQQAPSVDVTFKMTNGFLCSLPEDQVVTVPPAAVGETVKTASTDLKLQCNGDAYISYETSEVDYVGVNRPQGLAMVKPEGIPQMYTYPEPLGFSLTSGFQAQQPLSAGQYTGKVTITLAPL